MDNSWQFSPLFWAIDVLLRWTGPVSLLPTLAVFLRWQLLALQGASVCVCCKFWAVCVWVCVYMSCHVRAFCILCIMPPCVNLKTISVCVYVRVQQCVCVCVCVRVLICVAQVLGRLKTWRPNIHGLSFSQQIIRMSFGKYAGICIFSTTKITNNIKKMSCFFGCFNPNIPQQWPAFSVSHPHLGQGLFGIHHRGSRQLCGGFGLFAEAAVLQLSTFASWDEKSPRLEVQSKHCKKNPCIRKWRVGFFAAYMFCGKK